MKQIKGILYFFMTGTQYNLLIFWSILISTMVISMGIAYFMGQNGVDITMLFVVSMPVYIYCGILGFATVKQSIPYLLKMGATRKKMFAGLGLGFLIMTFGLTLLLDLFHTSFVWLTDMFNIDGYRLMHSAQLINDTFLNRFLIDGAVIMFIMASTFVLGLLFYKHGILGGGIFLGAVVILFFTGLGTEWLRDVVMEMYAYNGLEIFIWLFAAAGIMVYALGWPLIRRITVV